MLRQFQWSHKFFSSCSQLRSTCTAHGGFSCEEWGSARFISWRQYKWDWSHSTCTTFLWASFKDKVGKFGCVLKDSESEPSSVEEWGAARFTSPRQHKDIEQDYVFCMADSLRREDHQSGLVPVYVCEECLKTLLRSSRNSQESAVLCDTRKVWAAMIPSPSLRERTRNKNSSHCHLDNIHGGGSSPLRLPIY